MCSACFFFCDKTNKQTDILARDIDKHCITVPHLTPGSNTGSHAGSNPDFMARLCGGSPSLATIGKTIPDLRNFLDEWKRETEERLFDQANNFDKVLSDLQCTLKITDEYSALSTNKLTQRWPAFLPRSSLSRQTRDQPRQLPGLCPLAGPLSVTCDGDRNVSQKVESSDWVKPQEDENDRSAILFGRQCKAGVAEWFKRAAPGVGKVGVRCKDGSPTARIIVLRARSACQVVDSIFCSVKEATIIKVRNSKRREACEIGNMFVLLSSVVDSYLRDTPTILSRGEHTKCSPQHC